jgi:hypothetical protein
MPLAMRRCLVPARSLGSQIQAFRLVNSIGALVIVSPAFTPQEHVNARKTVSDPGLGDLFDALADGSVVARTLQFVINKRAGNVANGTRASSRNAVFVDQLFDELPPLLRPQSFFFNTSCSICLSNVRSATTCFNRAFSSSSCRKRLSSAVPSLENFRFQLKNVASEMHILRQTSATGTTASACLSENYLLFREL